MTKSPLFYVCFFFFYGGSLFSEASDQEIKLSLKRIQSLCVIEDYQEAKIVCEKAIEKYSHNLFLQKEYMRTLALNLEEEKALSLFKKFEHFLDFEKKDRHLIEELSWSILTKGLYSDQYETKLASIVGAYLTKDVRSLFFLLKGMQDGNANVRGLSIMLASQFPDVPLKKEFKRLLHEEKLWSIRLEVIKAIGHLKLKEFYPDLEEIFLSSSTSIDEKGFALEGLINMTETISLEKLNQLFKSPYAALRQFACSIALHLQIPEAKEEIIKCLEDKSGYVRQMAIFAYSLYFHELDTLENQKRIFEQSLKDFNPQVALIGIWGYVLIDSDKATLEIKKYLESSSETIRHFASSILASCGERTSSLAYQVMHTHPDHFVKVNAALGLLGQNLYVKEAYDTIYNFLNKEKRKLDFKEFPFRELTLSQLNHTSDTTLYPETVDMQVRLSLVNLLAQGQDARALELMKNYLQVAHSNIAAIACASLLQEGDQSSLSLVQSLLEDKNPEIRIQAAVMLASLGKDSSVLHVLEKAYSKVNHENKQMILEAMGSIATSKNLPFFIEVFEEPFYVRKILAASSLLRSLYH
jgi:HEAT repeat protein